MASDLGVHLYSRKKKSSLIQEIFSAQSKFDVAASSRQSYSNTFFGKKDVLSQQQLVKDTRVVFLPRDPQWAYVFWEISEKDRSKAQTHGAIRLSLKLMDVTGMEDGGNHKQTLQEIPVDSYSTEWYVPIPLSDRDYKVELGYHFANKWISLANSSSARVPSFSPSDQILDQFVPFSLESNMPTPNQNDLQITNDKEDSSLHERLYNSATNHFSRIRVGSEEFQGREFSQSSQSGIGLWASGRNESGLGGLKRRQRNFWLVADAELIIYGSTDPSAKLTIGGEEIPLSSDGTFRLQVPFRDGSQNYPIEAVDSDGSQNRDINMQFERVTLEDNTNTSDQSQAEWF